jgi:uncharacterized protein GlcG (DUF336 family)
VVGTRRSLREVSSKCRGRALPVVVDGEVIGAIGASFATPAEDEQVAKAGLAAFSH